MFCVRNCKHHNFRCLAHSFKNPFLVTINRIITRNLYENSMKKLICACPLEGQPQQRWPQPPACNLKLASVTVTSDHAFHHKACDQLNILRTAPVGGGLLLIFSFCFLHWSNICLCGEQTGGILTVYIWCTIKNYLSFPHLTDSEFDWLNQSKTRVVTVVMKKWFIVDVFWLQENYYQPDLMDQIKLSAGCNCYF